MGTHNKPPGGILRLPPAPPPLGPVHWTTNGRDARPVHSGCTATTCLGAFMVEAPLWVFGRIYTVIDSKHVQDPLSGAVLESGALSILGSARGAGGEVRSQRRGPASEHDRLSSTGRDPSSRPGCFTLRPVVVVLPCVQPPQWHVCRHLRWDDQLTVVLPEDVPIERSGPKPKARHTVWVRLFPPHVPSTESTAAVACYPIGLAICLCRVKWVCHPPVLKRA